MRGGGETSGEEKGREGEVRESTCENGECEPTGRLALTQTDRLWEHVVSHES